MPPSNWNELSPLLDRALDLQPDARAAWLSELARRQPVLHEQLVVLLRNQPQLEAADFLGELPPMAREAMRGPIGQRVGAYEIDALIGQGGMGSVWSARRADGRFEARAAVKFLAASALGPEGLRRFEREGRIVARLSHPNIARLLDAGVDQTGRPYLVLEYVEGLQIDAFCREQRLEVDARIALFVAVLDAVAHAHALLIVHRDIKPGNILVTADGAPKLLDFGIAKLLDDGDTNLTADANRMLTLGYAAPEQVQGGTISVATDVYALGVLLYELLTGQHPLRRDDTTPAMLLQAILQTDPVLASKAVQTLPADLQQGHAPARLARQLRGDLDTILAKALAKDPADRFASVTAFADDLRRYLAHEPVLARRPSYLYRTGKFVHRNRGGVSAAAVAVLAVLAGLVGTVTQGYRAEQEARSAIAQRQRADSAAAEAVRLRHAAEQDAANARLQQRRAVELAAVAERASQQAELQRRRAEIEARKAQAVGDFMTGIFARNRIDEPDPMKARETPARVLLLQAARQAAEDERTPPEVRAAVLGRIDGALRDLLLISDAIQYSLVRIRLLKSATPRDWEALAYAQLMLANAYHYDGRHDLGRPYLADARQSLAKLRTPSREVVGVLEYLLGEDALAMRKPAEAGRHFEAALANTTDLSQRIRVYFSYATIPESRGDLEMQGRILNEALAELRKAGQLETVNASVLLRRLADHYENVGDLPRSKAALQNALAVVRKVYGGDDLQTADILGTYGTMLSRMGEFDRALPMLLEAQAMAGRHAQPDSRQVTSKRQQLADAQWLAGQPDQAAANIDASYAEAQQRKNQFRIMTSSIQFARVHFALGDYAAALAAARQCIEIMLPSKDESVPAFNAQLTLATQLIHAGELDEAQTIVAPIVQLTASRPALRRAELQARLVLAELELARQRPAEAAEQARRVRDGARTPGFREYPGHYLEGRALTMLARSACATEPSDAGAREAGAAFDVLRPVGQPTRLLQVEARAAEANCLDPGRDAERMRALLRDNDADLATFARIAPHFSALADPARRRLAEK